MIQDLISVLASVSPAEPIELLTLLTILVSGWIGFQAEKTTPQQAGQKLMDYRETPVLSVLPRVASYWAHTRSARQNHYVAIVVLSAAAILSVGSTQAGQFIQHPTVYLPLAAVGAYGGGRWWCKHTTQTAPAVAQSIVEHPESEPPAQTLFSATFGRVRSKLRQLDLVADDAAESEETDETATAAQAPNQRAQSECDGEDSTECPAEGAKGVDV